VASFGRGGSTLGRIDRTIPQGVIRHRLPSSANLDKSDLRHVTTVPLLVLDDLGMKRLPHTAAEDLLEIVMRRYERTSTLITSNRPVEDWGKLLGDTAAVTALLDRLLHHAHVLTCGPRSWRTRLQGDRNPS
jgi:DNA replication protein DnaC